MYRLLCKVNGTKGNKGLNLIIQTICSTGIRVSELEFITAEAKLEDRRMKIENSGSIAEAVLALNGFFEAAQAAADEYLKTVKENYEKTEFQ